MTRRNCAWLLGALLGRGLSLNAQEAPTLPRREPKPASSEENGPVIRVDVDVVNLVFTVRKAGNGELVPSLTKDEFAVFEDGKPQTISNFSRESNLPLELGMLIDVSRSQTRLIDTERQAGASFFANTIQPKDNAFLLAFGRDTVLLQDFTNSVPKLQSALNSVKVDSNPGRPASNAGGGRQGGGSSWPAGGGMGWPGGAGRRGGRRGGGGYPPRPSQSRGDGKGTLLFDAVYLACNDEINRKEGRKALFLITDGEDHGSYYSREQAIEAAQRGNAMIYSIYYVDAKIYQRLGIEQNGSVDLQAMSEETGGRVFEVGKDRTLEDVFTEIQAEMRSQYSLGYKSTNPNRNGEFRTVEIRPHTKSYQVQTRKGYYAAKNRPA